MTDINREKSEFSGFRSVFFEIFKQLEAADRRIGDMVREVRLNRVTDHLQSVAISHGMGMVFSDMSKKKIKKLSDINGRLFYLQFSRWLEYNINSILFDVCDVNISDNSIIIAETSNFYFVFSIEGPTILLLDISYFPDDQPSPGGNSVVINFLMHHHLVDAIGTVFPVQKGRKSGELHVDAEMGHRLNWHSDDAGSKRGILVCLSDDDSRFVRLLRTIDLIAPMLIRARTANAPSMYARVSVDPKAELIGAQGRAQPLCRRGVRWPLKATIFGNSPRKIGWGFRSVGRLLPHHSRYVEYSRYGRPTAWMFQVRREAAEVEQSMMHHHPFAGPCFLFFLRGLQGTNKLNVAKGTFDNTDRTAIGRVERERGIIASAAPIYCRRDYRFNIIDMLGHADFTIEAGRGLRVFYGAVAVVSRTADNELGTKTVWRLCSVNKVDRVGTDLWVERAGEQGETVHEAYIARKEPNIDTLPNDAIDSIPVVGPTFKNKGIQPLLDAKAAEITKLNKPRFTKVMMTQTEGVMMSNDKWCWLQGSRFWSEPSVPTGVLMSHARQLHSDDTLASGRLHS